MATSSDAYQPYTLDDVEQQRATNGYRAVSTFSGIGGSCFGLELAGFDVTFASEFIAAAQDCYRLNHPATYLDTRDIRELSADEILNTVGIEQGDLDLFEGSPPCSAFSVLGRGPDGWGKAKAYSGKQQVVDDLFFEWTRLLTELQPRMCVAENVPGLIEGPSRGYFNLIMQTIRDAGYYVEANVLDSARLGVPQQRKRLFIVAVRKDLDPTFEWPKPTHRPWPLRDMLPDVIEAWAKLDFAKTSGDRRYAERVSLSKPCPTIIANGATLWGTGSWGLRRSTTDHDAPAAVAAVQAAYESTTKRTDTLTRLTITELCNLASFPVDTRFVGTYNQQWERIGRSVPPLMMRALATQIRRKLDTL